MLFRSLTFTSLEGRALLYATYLHLFSFSILPTQESDTRVVVAVRGPVHLAQFDVRKVFSLPYFLEKGLFAPFAAQKLFVAPVGLEKSLVFLRLMLEKSLFSPVDARKIFIFSG